MPALRDLRIRTTPRAGPLTRLESERAYESLSIIFYEQGRSPTHRDLAAELGIQRSSIPKLLERFFERARKDRPSIEQRRETMARQLEQLFSRTVRIYAEAHLKGKLRDATEAVKAGADVLTRLAKVVGIEDTRPAEEGRARVRITFEGEWAEGAPPAAIAAAARIAAVSTAPESAHIPLPP